MQAQGVTLNNPRSVSWCCCLKKTASITCIIVPLIPSIYSFKEFNNQIDQCDDPSATPPGCVYWSEGSRGILPPFARNFRPHVNKEEPNCEQPDQLCDRVKLLPLTDKEFSSCKKSVDAANDCQYEAEKRWRNFIDSAAAGIYIAFTMPVICRSVRGAGGPNQSEFSDTSTGVVPQSYGSPQTPPDASI